MKYAKKELLTKPITTWMSGLVLGDYDIAKIAQFRDLACITRTGVKEISTKNNTTRLCLI
jgi:hypothetical protein